MKKLVALFAILIAVVSVRADEPPTVPADRTWEAAPNVLSGGYSDQEGPYVYRFTKVVASPSELPYICIIPGAYHHHAEYKKFVSIGYGSFSIHKHMTSEGTIPNYRIATGNDDVLGVEFNYYRKWGGGTIAESVSYTGLADLYVYKKENIQHMEIAFSSASYTAREGQNLAVNVFVIGGSGYYSGVAVKPVFLSAVGKLAYEGKCYKPLTTSISVVVKDKVTGQECAASADIIITEKPVNDNNSGSSGNSGTSSDPGGTAADPGSSSSGDGGNNGGDDGTSAGDGDTGDNSGDNGGNDDDSGAVDPGGSDDEPATEPDDSSDDETEDNNDPDDSSATDPGSDNNIDSQADNSTADTPDDTDDSADQTNSSGDDDAVVVVPDGTDPTDTSGGADIADNGSDSSDNSDTVIISDDTEADEPTIIVINDSTGSDSNKIVVTNDGVIKVDSDNYDLAVFMGMFGAMTALNGSATTSESAPMAVQEARGKDHE